MGNSGMLVYWFDCGFCERNAMHVAYVHYMYVKGWRRGIPRGNQRCDVTPKEWGIEAMRRDRVCKSLVYWPMCLKHSWYGHIRWWWWQFSIMHPLSLALCNSDKCICASELHRQGSWRCTKREREREKASRLYIAIGNMQFNFKWIMNADRSQNHVIPLQSTWFCNCMHFFFPLPLYACFVFSSCILLIFLCYSCVMPQHSSYPFANASWALDQLRPSNENFSLFQLNVISSADSWLSAFELRRNSLKVQISFSSHIEMHVLNNHRKKNKIK